MSSTLYATACAACILLAASWPSAALAIEDDSPTSRNCIRDFRIIDDKADEDVRSVDERITRLRAEIDDPFVISGSAAFRDGLRVRLAAAEADRSGILSKQHIDLNATRARCDRLRDAERSERVMQDDSGQQPPS